jgi:hypothetical protein
MEDLAGSLGVSLRQLHRDRSTVMATMAERLAFEPLETAAAAATVDDAFDVQASLARALERVGRVSDAIDGWSGFVMVALEPRRRTSVKMRARAARTRAHGHCRGP